MAAIVQKGTAIKIGFGSAAYTGTVLQSVTRESTGEQKVIKGQDNQTHTVLVEDLGDRYTVRALILESGGSIDPPDIGATLTITNPSGSSVAGRVESANVEHGAEESILNFTIIKEVAMTYS